MSSHSKLVTEMAKTLAGADVDLSDERECMQALIGREFLYRDVVLYSDAAIRDARARRQAAR